MNPRERATQEYAQAVAQAYWEGIVATLTGEPDTLLPFGEARRRLRIRGERHRGVQAIPVRKVIGSVDRYADFNRHFLPTQHHTEQRWKAIAQAQYEFRELPPIQVYQMGEVYFVKDGNHRVSVARRRGQVFIDAEVIECDVPVGLAEGDSIEDLIIKGEYASFLEATSLDLVRPDHYQVHFTAPGRYDRLLDHIAKRQYFLGLKHQREVPWEEAVGSWYDRLYKRVVDESRDHGVLARFPGRTEADLYLWIMDHRYFLTQRAGADPGSETSALDFARRFAPSPVLGRIKRMLRPRSSSEPRRRRG